MLVGTGLSQALLILPSPVLSRLYDPKAFGVLAAFVAASAVIARVATGCYEHAILVPAEDEDARGLLLLALAISAVVCALLLGLVLVIAGPLSILLSVPSVESWMWLIPILGALSAALESLSHWFNRQKRYKLLAVNRVGRSVVTVFFMLAFGVVDGTGLSLVMATSAGAAFGVLNLVIAWFRQERRWERRFDLTKSRRLARRYRDFVFFAAPGNLLNSVTRQGPVLILGAYFGPAVVGAYNFSQRVLVAPQAVVATAVGDVFRQRAAEDLIQFGDCRKLWWKTFRVLTLASLPGFGLLILAAPEIFAFAFGEDWRTAGDYARLAAPLFLVALPASTLGRVNFVAERQREDLVWQLALFVVTGAALLVGGETGSASLTIFLFSASYAVMYLVYLKMSHRYSVAKASQGSASRGIYSNPKGPRVK
jgi:O-antigen/teichoic acid export membrane protein